MKPRNPKKQPKPKTEPTHAGCIVLAIVLAVAIVWAIVALIQKPEDIGLGRTSIAPTSDFDDGGGPEDSPAALSTPPVAKQAHRHRPASSIETDRLNHLMNREHGGE